MKKIKKDWVQELGGLDTIKTNLTILWGCEPGVFATPSPRPSVLSTWARQFKLVENGEVANISVQVTLHDSEHKALNVGWVHEYSGGSASHRGDGVYDGAKTVAKFGGLPTPEAALTHIIECAQRIYGSTLYRSMELYEAATSVEKARTAKLAFAKELLKKAPQDLTPEDLFRPGQRVQAWFLMERKRYPSHNSSSTDVIIETLDQAKIELGGIKAYLSKQGKQVRRYEVWLMFGSPGATEQDFREWAHQNVWVPFLTTEFAEFADTSLVEAYSRSVNKV